MIAAIGKFLTGWAGRLAPYLLCAALGAVVWLQRETLTAQGETIQGYGQQLADMASDNRAITATIDAYGDQLRQLAGTETEIRSALAARQREIGNLQRENADFRTWAESVLPADVVRLRERPALTGAQAYREYLRARDALRPVGGESADERRPQ